MRYVVGAPMVVQLTFAAKHDHYICSKKFIYPKTPLLPWIMPILIMHKFND